MVVQHNLTAINANRYFGMNNSKLSKSLEKLSSGYAINRAGDNAAGLAVSEKMRSQIAGINQGVKNAQDGISMVQTFEGALTETHSILQRMKTLATQSANGTYDDPVDRNAIQQEFLQLNDELDQIADTDFNGVVVLNGGVMADGVAAAGVTVDPTTGKKTFDAAMDGAGLINYREPNNQAKAVLDAQVKELEDQKAAITNPTAITLTDIDEVAYTKTAADNLWKDLGISVDDINEVTITFTANADGTFTATSATGAKGGNAVDADIDVSKVSTENVEQTTGTGEGGFKISSTSNTGAISNAIFDATNVKAGDVVAVKFTNTSDKAIAPKNIGFKDNSADQLNGEFSSNGDAKIQLSGDAAALTDETMTSDWKAVFDALKAATVDVQYTKDGTADTTAATGAITISDTTNFNIDTNGTITLKKAFGGVAANTEIAKFTADTGVKELAGQTNGSTTAKYGIAIENYDAPAAGAAGPDASAATATADPAAADAARKAIDDKIAALKNAYAVSQSNSFDNSEAKMTYADSITLQVGARTKDAVNFTFKYDSTAMGDLDPDLDCTAAGLGTDKLSLGTQTDANAAIDKIDQAINKVSMVRGTFGAIQNRLEHKIDNLNTTSENLTSAESRIRDTNMAEEMMNFTKNQILSQASQSMLAQANQLPQGVLSLLQ